MHLHAFVTCSPWVAIRDALWFVYYTYVPSTVVPMPSTVVLVPHTSVPVSGTVLYLFRLAYISVSYLYLSAPLWTLSP